MAIPIILLGVLGCVFAVILAVASKVMAVPVDEKQIEVRAVLPGANCGACGFAGCDDYAAAVAADPENVPTTACTPGGAAAANSIAEILGVAAGSVVPQKAYLKCSGDCSRKTKTVEYSGYKSCEAAKQFYGGEWSCKEGCLGLGDCEAACPYDAIQMFNGIPGFDHSRCVGCGICANVCPQKIIDIMPESVKVMVKCSNHDIGKKAMQACKVSCIGCKKCEKACKFDAIHVENGLAYIDQDKCKSCGLCVKACPKDAIIIDRQKGKKKKAS